MALDSQIQPVSTFDRKHYFYADNPSGYQITQKYAPLAKEGRLQIRPDGYTVRIEQIQLEQDTAKSTTTSSGTETLIDLNRAGAGLMEIVSHPDMRTPEDAGSYVRALRALLRAVGASDGNMDEGSLRCDVNVSVNREGEPFGTRCEVKNINSVRFLMSAILCEIHRQTALLSSGQKVAQETRGYDEDSVQTYSLRSKEDAVDYRYMPDPNLGVLKLSEDYLSRIRTTLPELPTARASRLATQYSIPTHDVRALMAFDASVDIGLDGERAKGSLVDYFEGVVGIGEDGVVEGKAAINWISQELLGQLAHRGETFSPDRIPVSTMRGIILSVKDRTITGTSAKTLLRYILDTPSALSQPLSALIDTLQLRSLSSPPSSSSTSASTTASSSSSGRALDALIQSAITALPTEAASARKGNERVIMRLVGHVMKASRGTVDARDVADLLRAELLPKGETKGGK